MQRRITELALLETEISCRAFIVVAGENWHRGASVRRFPDSRAPLSPDHRPSLEEGFGHGARAVLPITTFSMRSRPVPSFSSSVGGPAAAAG